MVLFVIFIQDFQRNHFIETKVEETLKCNEYLWQKKLYENFSFVYQINNCSQFEG